MKTAVDCCLRFVGRELVLVVGISVKIIVPGFFFLWSGVQGGRVERGFQIFERWWI